MSMAIIPVTGSLIIKQMPREVFPGLLGIECNCQGAGPGGIPHYRGELRYPQFRAVEFRGDTLFHFLSFFGDAGVHHGDMRWLIFDVFPEYFEQSQFAAFPAFGDALEFHLAIRPGQHWFDIECRTHLAGDFRCHRADVSAVAADDRQAGFRPPHV